MPALFNTQDQQFPANPSASEKMDIVRRLARERLLAIEALAAAGPLNGDGSLADVLKLIARACGVILIIFASVVLLGWITPYETLRSIYPKLDTIVPLKAAAFLFSGIAILLFTGRQSDEGVAKAGKFIFPFLTLAIGAITLFEYASGYSLIDTLILPEIVSARGGINPGRISLPAALNFTIAGIGLFLLAFRNLRAALLITIAALIIFFSGLVSFLAFLFNFDAGIQTLWFENSTVNASLAFILLSVALIFARSDNPIARLLTGHTSGSHVARIFFPAVIIIHVLIGYAIVTAVRSGIFNPGVAGVFGVGSSVLLLFVIVWLTSSRLDRLDRLRIRDSGRLRHSERLLRALVEATSDFVWAQSASVGRGYTEWWKELTGQTEEELAGYGWIEALHPEDRERVKTEWETALAEGSEFRSEYRVKTKTGEYGIFRVRGIPIRDDEGRVVEWVGTFDDVTAARRAEEAVRNSERKFRILAEAFEDNIWEVSSPDLENVEAPGWWRNLTGQSDEDVKNFGWLAAVHPDDTEEAARVIGSGFREKRTWMHTFRVRRKDGQYRIYRLKCVPIFDESGNFMQWIGSSRDVTEENEAEQRIRDLNRQLVSRTRELEELNSELSAFTYSVSHDLRAPLRAMEGFSAAITEDYAGQLDETGRNYLQRIRSASLRMSEMIDALLTLSRLTRKPPEMETIDLTAMAEDIFNLFRASDPKRNVNITIAPDMTDRGDPRLIRLVLQNLFANAWKFTSKRPVAEIEFGMLKTKGERVYFVRDNGAGFDMTYAEKLFTPFQRLHRADEFEGSGIGLATVQRIIRQHGGYVRAEGKPDNGAVFYFTLKVDDPEAK